MSTSPRGYRARSRWCALIGDRRLTEVGAPGRRYSAIARVTGGVVSRPIVISGSGSDRGARLLGADGRAVRVDGDANGWVDRTGDPGVGALGDGDQRRADRGGRRHVISRDPCARGGGVQSGQSGGRLRRHRRSCRLRPGEPARSTGSAGPATTAATATGQQCPNQHDSECQRPRRSLMRTGRMRLSVRLHADLADRSGSVRHALGPPPGVPLELPVGVPLGHRLPLVVFLLAPAPDPVRP